MSKQLYYSVTNTSGIVSVAVMQSYSTPTAAAEVVATTTSLSIGDAATVVMGYTGDNAQLLTGYVKNVERNVPDNTYTINIQDKMVRAIDYFIASSNPNTPFTRSAIPAEDLIQDLMALAGLTAYNGGTTNFIYGYTVPVEVNLTGCYEYCKQLADILAWHIYVDSSGVVQFQERKPFVVAGDTPSKTIDDDSNILRISYSRSDDDLRNRIVVYGAGSIYAEASSSSPYLPAGFYKSTVLSSPYVDRQVDANTAASENLGKWNRLRDSVVMDIEGDPDIQVRDIIHLTESSLSLDDDYFVFGAQHVINSSGYITALDLRS
jgi:hypothetical protein